MGATLPGGGRLGNDGGFSRLPGTGAILWRITMRCLTLMDDMDVNCGTIPNSDETVAQCGERIFDLILRVASGEKTTSESFDFGAAEFAPWVIGATM